MHFDAIHISGLENDDLYELKALLLNAINEREGKNDDSELF